MKPATNGQRQWEPLLRLMKDIWRNPGGRNLRVRVLLAMLCLLIAKAVNVCVPFLLKYSIDSLSQWKGSSVLAEASTQTLLLSATMGIVISYALARILSQIFSELRDFVFAFVSQHTQRSTGLETFSHLHSLSLAFHLDRQTGGLTRVVERGTRGIQTVLQFMLFNIVPTLLEVVIVGVVLTWTFGWKFAAITWATIGTYIWFTLAVTNWRVRFRRDMMARDMEANTKAVDSLLNFETVKYFCNEQHEANRYDTALAAYEKAALESQGSLAVLNIGQGVIIALGLVGVMSLAALGIMRGAMTVGDFVMVNAFLIQLYMPLNFLGFAYRETTQSLTEMEKMYELLSQSPDVRDSDRAPPLKVPVGEIVFDQVSFSYQPNRQILKNISFTVPGGKTVALVGPSGSGKSTIARLLFRFYDVSVGSIRIDGQDLRAVKQQSLRAAIGIVPQDTVLFNDTIAYNIRYGRPAASDEEIREAARLAEIDEFIQSLPEKYKTMVGERGLKLSGGEKQRVAIARTILKNPSLFVFDEATSALDTHTERAIQASLDNVSRNRTTLVIAHRLSTVVDADEILVLRLGEIVERGKHEDLVARPNGMYAEMWAQQATESSIRSSPKANLSGVTT